MAEANDAEPRKLLIAGGGMAAVEAVLALRDLAPPGLAIELLSPTDELVYVPNAVLEPFAPGSMRRYPLDMVLAEREVRRRDGALARVEANHRRVVTEAGERLGYDLLLVCVGARPREAVPGAITFLPLQAREVADLVADATAGKVASLAFIVPPGVAWSLPAYELALLTRLELREHGVEAELAVVSPESEPLEVFGEPASEAVAALLAQSGVRFAGARRAERCEDGAVLVAGGERIGAERAVALPRLGGPRVEGLPHDEQGFLPVDEHGQVEGTETVWAAGDATSFPLKQGGLATQQADAAAEAIAARLGAAVEPAAFNPILRGKLIAEQRTEYLRAAIAQGRATASAASPDPLWTPAAKVAGRYLAPHLQRLDRERG